MTNIFDYFATFLRVLFANHISFYTPASVVQWVSSSASSASSFESFLLNLLVSPDYFLSLFVWIWFAVLTVNLLLIFPYKWIRSVIRKCRLS